MGWEAEEDGDEKRVNETWKEVRRGRKEAGREGDGEGGVMTGCNEVYFCPSGTFSLSNYMALITWKF